MHLGAMEVTLVGNLIPGAKSVRKGLTGTEESIACQRAAIFLGKQFAQIGDRATIYSTLGIRP
jgi:hypothetical protein